MICALAMACPILRKLGIPNGGIPEYSGKPVPIGSLCLVGGLYIWLDERLGAS